MGVDYDANLAVGYRLTVDDLMERLGQTIPRQTHVEDRYDPRTGEKTDPVVIVDWEEHVALVLDDERFSVQSTFSMTEFCELVASKVGASWLANMDRYTDEFYDVTFGPAFDNDELTLAQLNDLSSKISRIGLALSELGLEPGEPIIAAVLSVY